MRSLIYLYIAFILLFSSCSLEQEVDLNLPEYEPQIMVECYLRPGQPYVMTLTESVGYFGDIQISFIKDATVTITRPGETIPLVPIGVPVDAQIPGGLVDTSFLNSLKPIIGDSLFFYATAAAVPEEYDIEYQLLIETKDGRKLRASTVIPKPVPIASMEYKFNDDSLAFVLTRWQDDPDQVNFYRRILLERRQRIIDLPGGMKDTVYNSREEQNFIIDDDIENGQLITVGTNFEYELGDTLIAQVQHITGDYYRFIETSDAAVIANLSPFGQPAIISSNIEGGMGIFTGFTIEEMVLVVGE